MSNVTLFESSVRVLKYLVEIDGDWSYANFDMITKNTGLEKNQARLACRFLSRSGLAQYGKGLSNEEGVFFGSGYACTTAGAKLMGES